LTVASEEETRMSLLDHLQELRSRLIRAVAAILMVSAVCMAFSERLFSAFASPISRLLPKDMPLVFTGLPDPFFVYLKLSFICGVFIALPYVLYQLWQFISPGLFDKERKTALPFVLLATLLFYVGAIFAYLVVFPAAFSFFLSYQTEELKPMISIREYVSLIMVLMLAFGAVFETPIVVVFLGLLGIFDSSQLKKGRRYFIIIAFIIGAILTPTPDPLNQTFMAVPMILLYELGVWILTRIEKRRAAEVDSESEPEPPAEVPPA
jgi:sec-independent protein translocase protein TatC